MLNINHRAFIYIYILHGRVCDLGFHALCILSDECLKHETQGHWHYHVIYVYISFCIKCI